MQNEKKLVTINTVGVYSDLGTYIPESETFTHFCLDFNGFTDTFPKDIDYDTGTSGTIAGVRFSIVMSYLLNSQDAVNYTFSIESASNCNPNDSDTFDVKFYTKTNGMEDIGSEYTKTYCITVMPNRIEYWNGVIDSN